MLKANRGEPYHVRVGGWLSRAAAEEKLKIFKYYGISGAFLVQEKIDTFNYYRIEVPYFKNETEAKIFASDIREHWNTAANVVNLLA